MQQRRLPSAAVRTWKWRRQLLRVAVRQTEREHRVQGHIQAFGGGCHRCSAILRIHRDVVTRLIGYLHTSTPRDLGAS